MIFVAYNKKYKKSHKKRGNWKSFYEQLKKPSDQVGKNGGIPAGQPQNWSAFLVIYVFVYKVEKLSNVFDFLSQRSFKAEIK